MPYSSFPPEYKVKHWHAINHPQTSSIYLPYIPFAIHRINAIVTLTIDCPLSRGLFSRRSYIDFIMHHLTIAKAITATAILSGPALAGPGAYGVCQAGCCAVVMACYAAAGATWGATAGATAPATVVACNTAFGACQASCHAALIFPIP
ncbi:uncharacterized protein PgNI_03574 [Pyricularia grisea]|uniref:Zygote-specific protein n=1 Tax=Pyricularia grisea TaxID=148305 RepID=A0A6P8BB77_PYRGI|nr:uncharacterized protein PgNI_03574 [Pyricularia grisea]TLD13059.1 hypothetical protein PgNI_03574 [Pyricularia grisea]